MKKPKIKHLIFDIGKVLVRYKKFNFEKLDKKLSLIKGTTKEIIRKNSKGKILNKNFKEKEFFNKNFSNILNWSDYKKILSEFYESESVNKTLVKWILRKKKKYKTSTLTNNSIFLRKLLRQKYKIHDLFYFIFNSAEIGLAKPDPKFFEYILKKLKTKPGECLFVDDNLENIKTAKKLGFLTILFQNNKKFFKKVKKLNI